MKKRNLKLVTALLAVALIASVSIFYACTKEEKDNNSDKSPKKEAEFVARNYDETCVKVEVFRDENNNAQFVITDVANDPKAVGFKVSDMLNIKSMQKNDDEILVIEIPGDAIYWLVPLDGNEPVKFEPLNNAKNIGSSGSVTVKCDCSEWVMNSQSNKCEKEYTQNGYICKPIKNGSCLKCNVVKCVVVGGSSEFTIVGGTYLIQSDIITIDGITYE